MSRIDKLLNPYAWFVTYVIVGIVSGSLTTLPCGTYFNDIHLFADLFLISFILIGIGVGLYSFIKNKKCSRLEEGIVTGLSVGLGGTTVVFLLTNPCV